MYKLPTKKQIETASKKAKNKVNDKIYLTGENKAKFLNWLHKKEYYQKIIFNEPEQDILKSLDRIKRIQRIGLYRVYQFISSLQNRNFYLIFYGLGKIKITESYDFEFTDKQQLNFNKKSGV